MSKFKFGDEIIAIVNHSQGVFKEGDTFIVDGFSCCAGCGLPCIYLKGNNELTRVAHSKCGYYSPGKERERYSEASFEKLISKKEAITYKLMVGIPELVKLKKLQNQ